MEPLATARELERHLGRELTDPDTANQALLLASGAVRAYCGWNLSYEQTVFEVDGDGGDLISLPTLHLVDLLMVKVNGVTVDPAGLHFPSWSRKGQLHRYGGWAPRAVVQATVKHGYDPVPSLITLVTLDLAARQVSNPEGLVSATVGPVTRTWSSGSQSDPTALSTLHSRLLDRYAL